MSTPVYGDGTGVPNLSLQIAKHVSSDFDSGVPGSHGVFATVPTYRIWTVTGAILVYGVWGVCNTSLASAGAATVEVGIAGSTALLIAQTTATDIDQNEVWAAAAPSTLGVSLAAVWSRPMAFNGAHIIETTATADISAGQIDYYMIWAPAETGASVTDSGALS